jgi:hypothetical protein
MKKQIFHFLSKNLLLSSLMLISSLSIKAQVRINEYSAANLSTTLDNFGKYEDWIEIQNTSATAVDIGGYFLTDSPDLPKQWAFPAGTMVKANGYLVVWASGRNVVIPNSSGKLHYHANFKLTQTKKKAESILLYDAAGVKLDEVAINKTRVGQTRGRTTDSTATWVIFKKPTVGNKNQGAFFKSNASKPSFALKPGFYQNAQTVTITTPDANSKIYYTTNGTEATVKSTLYTGPVNIAYTSVLKAITVPDDATIQASFMEFGTYFIGNKHTMNVVSITGDSLVVLAEGNKDRFPFGSFELFDATGERKATGYGEFNSHGQDSWVNDQRSLDFVCRDECGYTSALKHKIFAYNKRTEFQKLILRAAGDDNYPGGSGTPGGGAHLRDAYLQNLAKRGGMALDVRESEKTIIYINGRYWGVYDLRERPDDHDYTDFNYNQGKYDIQMIQTWGNTWAQYGEKKALDDWDKLLKYVKENDLKEQSKFDYVASQLDVKSLTDYVVTNTLTVCSDWLNYNTGWWRGQNPDGGHQKWGYNLWDNDATFAYYINYTGIADTSAAAKPCQVEALADSVVVTYPPYIAMDTMMFGNTTFFPGDTIDAGGTFTTFVDLNGHLGILKKLRQNPKFNQFYVTRQADLMNTVFSKKNMLTYLDSVYLKIKPEMTQHIQRWGGTVPEWEHNVAKLRDFISRHADSLQVGMLGCYNLTGPYDVTFNANLPKLAKLEINSQTIDKFPYTASYYGNIETAVKATSTDPNFQFDNWTIANQSTVTDAKAKNTNIFIKGKETVTANYIKGTVSVTDLDKNVLEPTFKAYPTTFNQQLTLDYELPKTATVSIHFYTLNGIEIAAVNAAQALQEKGHYTVEIDTNNALLSQNGLYLVKFKAGDFVKTVKVVKAN